MSTPRFTTPCELNHVHTAACTPPRTASLNTSKHARINRPPHNARSDTWSAYGGSNVGFEQQIPPNAQMGLTREFAQSVYEQANPTRLPNSVATYQTQGTVMGGSNSDDPRTANVLYGSSSTRGGNPNKVANTSNNLRPAIQEHKNRRYCAEIGAIDEYALDYPDKNHRDFGGKIHTAGSVNQRTMAPCGHQRIPGCAQCIYKCNIDTLS
ncbi:hypothetical protein B7494_g331 [Chlorociboria aeruginascens]|nr:hypothetical protein B7494_g331 [Chlorociboria aeruginascens]